jgi:hypothetical protein
MISYYTISKSKMISRRQGEEAPEAYVSYAIIAQLTGKDIICFYCAPFGDALPEVQTFPKPTTMPTKIEL